MVKNGVGHLCDQINKTIVRFTQALSCRGYLNLLSENQFAVDENIIQLMKILLNLLYSQ